jgi:hypothetical protein
MDIEIEELTYEELGEAIESGVTEKRRYKSSFVIG